MTPPDKLPPEPTTPAPAVEPAPALPTAQKPIYSMRADGTVVRGPQRDGSDGQEISHYELPPEIAQKLLSPAQLHDYHDQKQFGEGVGNIARAGLESGFNQAMLGAGDALMVAAGANARDIRERRDRNEVAAAVVGAGGFILPLVLTGGESALARVATESAAEAAAVTGTRLGAEAATAAAGNVAERTAARASADGLKNAIRFTPTTGGAAELGKAVQTFTERAMAGKVGGKLAGVLARNAAEGAIYNTGSAVSDLVRDGDDVLGDHETAAEYLLYHAVEGGVIGSALGGAFEGVAGAGKAAAGKVGEAFRGAREFVSAEPVVDVAAPASAGRAGEAQAKAAEASAAAQRAREEAARLDRLPDYVEPKSAAEAKKLITDIVTHQTGDAAGARAAVEDTAARLERLQAAHESVDRVVGDATTEVAQKLSRRAAIMDELQGKLSIGRKSKEIDAAIRSSADVAPIQAVGSEAQNYVAELKADLSEFHNDPDSKAASLSRRLSRFVDDADLQIKKAVTGAEGSSSRTAQADVHQALDNLKRSVGHARSSMAANAGDVELRNLPGRLQERYSQLADMLVDPSLFGEKVAAIQRPNNAKWTQFLDVAGGFEQEFLRRGEFGAGKTSSGWGALAQGDDAKVGSLLGGLIDPKNGLRLRVFTQGLDTGTELIEQLASSLKATPEERALVKKLRGLTGEIGDHLRDVAQAHADSAEYSALRGSIGAREKAITEATKAQERSAELGGIAREKAGEAGAEFAGKKADARAAANEGKAATVRGAVAPLVTGAVAAAGLGSGLPWWAAGGAIPLSSVVNQAMGRFSSEKLISATAAGFKATDRAATSIADYMTRSRPGKAVSAIASQVRRGSIALAEGDTRMQQYQRVRKELDDQTQNPVQFARTGPHAVPLTQTPMLQTAVIGKRANAVMFLRSKLPPEFKPLMPAPQLDKHPGVDGIQVRRFLRYAHAVNNPQAVLDAAAHGDVTPEGFEALRAVYPKIHAQLVQTIFDKLATADKQPSMRDAQNMSMIAGVPMHFTMEPSFVAGYQAVYAATPTEGPVNTDDQAMPRTARNIKARTPGSYATASQRVENGLRG